jgi:hypothetical protein
MLALTDNIKKFEAQHGMIKDTEMPPPLPMNFGGPAAMA